MFKFQTTEWLAITFEVNYFYELLNITWKFSSREKLLYSLVFMSLSEHNSKINWIKIFCETRIWPLHFKVNEKDLTHGIFCALLLKKCPPLIFKLRTFLNHNFLSGTGNHPWVSILLFIFDNRNLFKLQNWK